MSKINSKNRFSNRVKDYVAYRPGYPTEMLNKLFELSGLLPNASVADIGSGTGISSALFLGKVKAVYAIEPNRDMRKAAEDLFDNEKGFISVEGSSEKTGLTDNLVDLVSAGQAFHWFSIAESYTEFLRILKPPYRVALFWNERQTNSSDFLIDYEQLLLNHGTDYSQVNHANLEESVFNELYRNKDWSEFDFPNVQHMDFQGLKGRLTSSSYVPAETDSSYESMIEDLNNIFIRHNKNGLVDLIYSTRLFYGCLS